MPGAWSLLGRWQRLRLYLRRWRRAVIAPTPTTEPPLRAQLFSAEQMARHGETLARSHRVHARRMPDLLLARLQENASLLDEAREQLTQLVHDDVSITPAGEWLLDNYYLIEEHIRLARLHLPRGYSRQLPTLAEGAAAGMPRVFHLATEAITHGDGRVDARTMSDFVAAYQSVAPLKLGELWAIPIMLRLALVENLRRVALHIMRSNADRKRAVKWATRINQAAEAQPRQLILVLADMVRASPPASESFVAELMRGLHEGSAALMMPLRWMEQWLSEDERSVGQLVHADSQRRAADQVSISNTIGSLRMLASVDWRRFVESASTVERILRQDPAGIYAGMDFDTRDSYRHVVERLAQSGRMDESAVARTCLQLAQAGAPAATAPCATHVGHYLVGEGLAQLKAALRAAGHRLRGLPRTPRRMVLPAYLLSIALLVALFVAALLTETQVLALPWPALGLLVILAAVVFSELGVLLVNWLATLLVAPQRLPRLDFSGGIPADSRTLVVVPSMLANREGADALVAALEVRYLANRDAQLRFALLTDFHDAGQQALPGDQELLAHAARQMAVLNARYPDADGDRFFLLHRPRLWNAGEGCWMGHERKRGKLAALNRLLRDRERGRAAFMRIVGNLDALDGVRYVITLDTDTQLPRDAARELVATLAHPLNRAHFDAQRGRVTRGYGILQPVVGVSMSGRQSSRYARMYGSEPGIDPYTRMVSNVYQDLFGEGSFVGKGIYDVDAFERALRGRFPDNRILSHDLLEGCYARAGLVSDARLHEDYPSRYAADAARRERWIRGDWQLLPWLLPWVPVGDATAEGHGDLSPAASRRGARYERNPLSWLSRAKLLDNLRRSLVAPAAVALFVTGWTLLPNPLRWTTWLVSLLLLPVLLPGVRDLVVKPRDMALETHLLQVGQELARDLRRVFVDLARLPHEAYFSVLAIVRTLWRMAVSRRHLLQWTTAGEAERQLGHGMGAELRRMWFAPALAGVVAALLWWLNPAALAVAAPILLLWSCSPLLMAWLGQPRRHRQAALSASRIAFLHALARRTWAFFDVNVNAQDHWLPPDNVQESPAPRVARRTSPTNVGLSLLANLAACDFGYLTPAQTMQRCANTLATLEKLPRYRGHFYNWYDTQTLAPLPPRYVSTVDSGNLAGHLLVLRQGLLALVDAPVLDVGNMLDGLVDTLGVLEQEQVGIAEQALQQALAAFRQRLQATREAPPESLPAAARAFDALAACAAEVESAWPQAEEPSDVDVLPAAYWPRALAAACRASSGEARHFLPDGAAGTDADAAQATRIPKLAELLQASDPALRARARQRVDELEQLAHRAGQCAQMEYAFLYDDSRHLLAIGYNVDERQLDSGYYDLLASEARLCSFVAIAQAQLPQESWFALGRLLTEVDGEATLLSWSGSMFEYLMPQLVMPSYADTLLDQTAHNAVRAQIRHGARHGLPWGMSESGYNALDAQMNYQYRAFGVPRLGLKRGLGQDLVIAPYASMMALMVAPVEACRNLQRLTESGFAGPFGLYEAIDYTPARLPPGRDHALVRSYMAHHQGMGLLALLHLLREQPMQQRFLADAEFQATVLLLQERIPRTGLFHPHDSQVQVTHMGSAASESQMRVITRPSTSRPAVQLLSNGRYHALLTAAGGGYSRHGGIALTRWREDGTRDCWGSFCYLRDLDSGAFWSAAFQPTCVPVERYEAILCDARAEYRGRHRRWDMHMEVAVSAEDDIELRRLHLSNRTSRTRTMEVTTYAEVVLAPAASDDAHPAFSNLFVQTEIVRDKQALLCTRRRRSQEEAPAWLLHLVAVHGARVDAISYETDRARFLGRGNTPRAPLALTEQDMLSDTAGSVLDPIVAIRVRITLAGDQQAVIDMVTGMDPERAGCMALIDKYRDRHLADRVFDLAWTHSEAVRSQINASQVDANLFQRLAGPLVYAHAFLRAAPQVLLQNRRGQSGLWAHAISGDLPIVLLQVADIGSLDLVRQLVRAHAYWRMKGLEVDLVIWNEEQGGYRQELHDQILVVIGASPGAQLLDQRGGIFLRAAHALSQEDRILMQSVARVVLSDAAGSLAVQARRPLPPEPAMALLRTGDASADAAPGARQPDAERGLPPAGPAPPWPLEAVAEQLVLDNGHGAFSADGQEYVILSREHAPTPAPWANVLAQGELGSVVSEGACGYTWFENAHAFRLTPWHNDPVADACGEAIYLRDEHSGHVWSPTPLPCRGSGAYRTRHGFGYSVYEHVENGIASELWVFVGAQDAVKFSLLRLRNLSGQARQLSATGYVEWVLGEQQARTRMHVVTEVHAASGVLTARNPYNTDFSGCVAFFDVDAETRSHTADRSEFLGRNGHMGDPAALKYAQLSGRNGVGLDPCAAIQVPVLLAPGAAFETTFRLGAAASHDAAIALARRSSGVAAAHAALAAVREHWRQTLGALRVQTPEPEVDLLVNGWLPYQVLASRYLGRSGYYQSGGAFGFRDQLQDVMALVHVAPQLSREHLLRSAAQQFPEGDVLHWWHPPQGRGVRTRCSDDYLWLPLATCRYVEVTGDAAVLDEDVDFIDGRPLDADEASWYDLPVPAGTPQSLYRHCALALRRGMAQLGARGLPLIAGGDWNDGMNRVGSAGRGESAWLGFFLFDVLQRFARVARVRGDKELAAWCAASARSLQGSLEAHAWDGQWYRRAWFDDGTPLGSAVSCECRIDSISQSWAVLSGAAADARARAAMDSLDRHLVRREAGLVQLLDPPFDKTEKDPGYIRGYVPGVRENGGQYTHAAVWAAMAFARLGDTERAWVLARMINPVNHTRDAAGVARYKVEPYVLAADVYAVAPHVGRGGWTWYTGSAAWMYRLLGESLLGICRHGDRLEISPCIPAHWPGYALHYRHGGSLYVIAVTQVDGGSAALRLDGVVQAGLGFRLQDDAATHRVEIRWPRKQPTSPGA